MHWHLAATSSSLSRKMVTFSRPIPDNLSHIETCRSTSRNSIEIPSIDLSDSRAKKLIVKACQELGFFKVTNHGVSMELLQSLEAEALKFFNLTQQEKEKTGPPNPFGYGNKRIGSHGDVGWVEYLLFSTNLEILANNEKAFLPAGISDTLRSLVNEYVSEVRNVACDVLDMVAIELEIKPNNALSKLIRDEKSDSCFRLNHYPPCPRLEGLMEGEKLIGFGAHTDPQIISAVRSTNTSGLQICLRDGSWVSVPPDHTSFFFNVGDSLQVLTNGRFRSVKHRVLIDDLQSRLSMIYFGGPPLSERITPLSSVMEQGEESLYEEFTWSEYKSSAYKTRLGDNRLRMFEKYPGQNP